MARIFTLMSDWTGSGKYRAAIPGEALAAVGHEVMCSDFPLALDSTGQTFASTADVWVGHRTSSFDHSVIFQSLCRMLRTTMMVVDYDDDAWHIHHTNPAAGSVPTELLTKNVKCADLVTVCSEGLAAVVGQWNKNVAVLPNAIPDEVLDWPRQDRHPGRISLGWPASTSHSIDVHILEEALPRVSRDFILTLCGMDWPSLKVDRELVPWQPTLESYYAQIDFSIGLAPLSNDQFNFGKSDLKVIEYMARGVPFVASLTGPYVPIKHLHGKAGLFVSTADEWVSALEYLIDNESIRAQMGAYGKEWVRQNRTASACVTEREKAYKIDTKRNKSSFECVIDERGKLLV